LVITSIIVNININININLKRTQVFPIVAEQTNVAFCFGAFAIFSIFGQIFIYKEVKETK
jgi:hypothetical protein